MAVALSGCTFVYGTNTKRFARNMAFFAQHAPDKELTPKQREYLRTAVIRFSRQIDADVVALAFMPAAMTSYGSMNDALSKQELNRAEPSRDSPQWDFFA